MTIGQQIRKKRKELKLIQHELADKAGITTPTLQSIERDMGNSGIQNYKKVASALDMQLVVLLQDRNFHEEI